MSGKKNLHEGNILYFSLKVCKKKLVRKKSGSAFHCLTGNGSPILRNQDPDWKFNGIIFSYP